MLWSAKDLIHLPVNDRLLACPVFLREIVTQARTALNVSKVWIFGSRARGDATSRSDFDVAFLIDPRKARAWPKYAVTTQEEAATLHSLDLVNMKEAHAALQDQINEEGILIYEQESKK